MSGFLRTLTNNLVVVLLTLGLMTYAAINWVGGAIFEDRYQITIPMRDAGGLFPLQETTVLGHGVGQIKKLELTDTGVNVILEVRGKEAVPERALVQVLRRSTIGEQALNFIPVPSDWTPPEDPEQIDPATVPVAKGWKAAKRGATIDPVAVALPAQIPDVIESATDLFRAIPPEDLGTVVHELADALDGRADLLKELNRDFVDLNETLVDGIPEFRRLIDTSEPVLAELNEHREALAASFPALADVSETLAENRPTLEAVVDNGTPFLREFEAFVENTDANQSCLYDDFLALNERVGTPENLKWLKQGLDMHEAFYYGADRAIQYDPLRPGIAWFRVNVLLFEEATARNYVPRRDTPATKPGGACVSPFGVGVQAVRQADPQPPDPTSPGIDYAPLVAGGNQVEAEQSAASPGSGDYPQGRPDGDDRSARGAAAEGRGETPRTGGGVALVAPLALGLAWALRRVR